MTSQGSAHGRFTRAIQQRNLWAAETALRELGHLPTLEYALAYIDQRVEQKPEKLERAFAGGKTMTVTDGFSCGPIECTDSFAEQTVQLRGGRH